MQLRWEPLRFTYALVVLTESEDPWGVAFPQQEEWKSWGMTPCGNFTGFGQFLALVAYLSENWQNGWNKCLDGIDMAVQFRVRMRDLEDGVYISD